MRFCLFYSKVLLDLRSGALSYWVGQKMGAHISTQMVLMPRGLRGLSLNLGLFPMERNERPDPAASTQRVY